MSTYIYISAFECGRKWRWNFLHHIDVLLRNQLPNIIGRTENQWHELAWLNQITTFTIWHQPLTNFPKAISYYLNFKCGWQHTNLPSQRLINIKPWNLHSFSSCHTSKYAFLFHLFPLSQFNVPPPFFLWVVGKVNATIFKALHLSVSPSLSLLLYFKNLTGHTLYLLQRNMLSSSNFPTIMLSGYDMLQPP